MAESYELETDEREIILSEFVHKHSTPYFFCGSDDEELEAIHAEIQRGIDVSEETVTIDLPLHLVHQAEEKLKNIGWTMEEAINLYLYWYQKCPTEVKEWKAGHSISYWSEEK